MKLASADVAVAWALVLIAPAGVKPAEPGGTPSIFDPASTPARAVADYANLVLAICSAIFAIVALLIVISIVRFRAARATTDASPPQVYGSSQMELAWTVVPMLIVLALVTTRTILELQKTERPEGWLQIDVVGHQWWLGTAGTVRMVSVAIPL